MFAFPFTRNKRAGSDELPPGVTERQRGLARRPKVRRHLELLLDYLGQSKALVHKTTDQPKMRYRQLRNAAERRRKVLAELGLEVPLDMAVLRELLK